MMSIAKYILGLWVVFWIFAAQAEPVPLSDLATLLRQRLEVDPATRNPCRSPRTSCIPLNYCGNFMPNAITSQPG